MFGGSTFLEQSCCPSQLDLTTQAQSVSFQEGHRDLQLQLFQHNPCGQAEQTRM